MIVCDAVNIAKTNCYEINVSRPENCVELTFKGYWDESEEMKYYLDDIKAAVDMLKTGFIFIIDMSDFIGCISKYLTTTIEAQKYLVSKELKVTAEILPTNPIFRPICEMLSKESGMKTLYFTNRCYAQGWFLLNKN